MRVLMLGWEFPPYISGGLGTACQGLTRALSQQDVHVTFVLPRPIEQHTVGDVRVVSANSSAPAPREPVGATESFADTAGFENVTFHAVPANLRSPYQRARQRWAEIDRHIAAQRQAAAQPGSVLHEPEAEAARHGHAPGHDAASLYTGDLFGEADRYARRCVELARRDQIDVIHAHDWLTFPAGMAVAAFTGRPLVVHVHSTEFDRAGERIDQRIYEIERRGMHAAVRIITVSNLTRAILQHRYGVPGDRIDVVYNGIDPAPRPEARQHARAIKNGDRIVLFLGRVTMQKGPGYFIESAKKVLEKHEHVKFVITGSGDQIPEVIDLAARYGIGHKVTFTGFLEGEDVDRVFEMADVYVMPSVSEPFGLAALEAIRHDVPAIVSRTSGVSEALRHVLRVDFWNTDEIADKILAVLNHPPLAKTLCSNADREIEQFTWRDAAERCRRIYHEAMAVMPR
ncbi:MAG: glycosyltransferase [Phycisphaeraceae bacterium]